MINLKHVHFEIHDEVRKNDKVNNSFIKFKTRYSRMEEKRIFG